MKGLSIRKMILLVILLMAAGICLLLGIKVQQVTCGNVYILSSLQEGKTFLNSEISMIENEGIRLTYELRKVDAVNKQWMIKWILQIFICAGSLSFTVKITQLSWCAPPNYELLEKSWKDVLYRILEFYTLSGIEIDNMQFVNRWNLLTMIPQIVCIGTGFLFFIEM